MHGDKREIVMDNQLAVVEAKYLGGLTLELLFSDGLRRQLDFAPYLISHAHPQYNRYLQPRNFKRFNIEHGNVVWGKNWDLVFPIEQLYSGQLI